MAKKDYVIVGAGLFGAVCARELTDAGKSVVVVDKRDHIGGNCYSEEIAGIHVSKYGGHIFHTNNEGIWNYVNKFADFRPYYHFVRVSYKGEMYSFPINMMTLNKLWGVQTPAEAEEYLEHVREDIENPENLEEWILSKVGREIYETFVKGYTKKQWDKDPKDLPTFIIKRLPIRLTYSSGYFVDKYQGWPENGYTEMFDNLLDGITVETGVNFSRELCFHTDKIIYTGKIDEYFKYKYGELQYRGLKHDTKVIHGDFQGCATVNYTDEDVPYTRIVEHKHFQPHKKNDKTVITTEYSVPASKDDIPFYPINDKENNEIYKKYKKEADEEKNVIFGGRLAEYKYYDMHQVVASALKTVKQEKKSWKK